ncbi:YeeE/YedE family protein [Luminiphilus syltensis NOR5-1B]|uniref:YeeE/YedE family protein n=1 Tax=Luminiphilus syltensis NOR5-1B TaxID=565045 RepID=B8KS20_9GAMM|nr:YeeE/YedE thiosulfate transporter family protein [Luminiphilus syltensis]EED36609.1 YeeE/YedE family protein [Luminiphilus syltensis NOR5-1B]
MTLFIGFLIGCAFGAILFLGGATSYRRILGTLLLKDLWIIKLMATAIGVGTIGIYALDFVGLANLSVKPVYIGGVALGGLIFGIGWAVSGYCPGTCVVGSAEGKTDAMATLAGGLVGALLFALAIPLLSGALIEPLSFGAVTMPDLLGISGIWLALPFGAALLMVAFVILRERAS